MGAGFLPTLVGAGLLLSAVALIARSFRRRAYTDEGTVAERPAEHFGSSVVVMAVVVAYIVLADTLGFLLVAPVCLLATFLALRVKASHAVLWALAGTLVVHIAFYKLLRVPLPWGILRPFY